VYIVLDDVGFSAMEPYGGLIKTFVRGVHTDPEPMESYGVGAVAPHG
jgi:hypothetical protein